MKLPPAFLRGPIAHRGLHGDRRPENSMAAYRAAIERGVGIELDVQPSSDGVPMAFHDYDLARLTGARGPVSGRNAEALSALPLGGAAAGIPRLSEVLEMVAGRVPLLIEIKDRDGDMGPAIGPLEDAVADVLAGYHGDVAAMSFNPHSVARMRDRAPDLPRGLVTSDFRADRWPELSAATRARLAEIPDYAATGACFVSHDVDALDMDRLADLRAEGAAILCWTVRSPAQAAEARRFADAVTFEGYLP